MAPRKPVNIDGTESISAVARRNSVAPNLLYRWRNLMLEGGGVAGTGDDDVTSNKRVRQMEDRIRDLERQLGRKTLEAPTSHGQKRAMSANGPRTLASELACRIAQEPMKLVAETLGVSRSNPHDRMAGRTKPRRRYHKAQDGERRTPCVRVSRERVAADPAAGGRAPPYGYHRITAVLNRLLRAEGPAPANHKRVYPIMKDNNFLLARRYEVVPISRTGLRRC